MLDALMQIYVFCFMVVSGHVIYQCFLWAWKQNWEKCIQNLLFLYNILSVTYWFTAIHVFPFIEHLCLSAYNWPRIFVSSHPEGFLVFWHVIPKNIHGLFSMPKAYLLSLEVLKSLSFFFVYAFINLCSHALRIIVHKFSFSLKELNKT